jgi:hypothetical protein
LLIRPLMGAYNFNTGATPRARLEQAW